MRSLREGAKPTPPFATAVEYGEVHWHPLGENSLGFVAARMAPPHAPFGTSGTRGSAISWG